MRRILPVCPRARLSELAGEARDLCLVAGKRARITARLEWTDQVRFWHLGDIRFGM